MEAVEIVRNLLHFSTCSMDVVEIHYISMEESQQTFQSTCHVPPSYEQAGRGSPN
jgi:hypothetical protein